MTDGLVLLALVMAFFGMTAMRAVLVYRRTGINPVKLRRDGSVHGVLDRILKASVACWLFISMVYALAPAMKPWLAPITYLETGAAHTTGAVVAATAILWIAVAQAQMSASFRMGFDPSEKTDLICDGPFSLSRNPIYLGILVGGGGFFLMAPNALSFGAAVIAFIGIRCRSGWRRNTSSRSTARPIPSTGPPCAAGSEPGTCGVIQPNGSVRFARLSRAMPV